MGYLAAVLCALFVAGAFAFQKALVAEISALSANAAQMALMLPLCVVFLACRGVRRGLRVARGLLFNLILLGSIASVLFVSLLAGLSLCSLTTAALLRRLDLFFTCVLGALILHETLRLPDYAGLALMVAGAVCVMDVRVSGLQFGGRGELLLVLSALALGVNAVLIRGTLTGLRNETIILANAGTQVVLCGALALAAGRAGEFLRLASEPRLLLVAAGASVTSFGGFWFYYAAMKRLPAWEVRGFQLLVPVFALVIGLIWFHETPSLRQWIGMFILFAGTGVIVRGAWTKRSRSSPA